MKVIRNIANTLVVVFGGLLAAWALFGLFGVDQRTHLLSPFIIPGTESVTIIMLGFFWGFLLIFGAGDFVSRSTSNPFAALTGTTFTADEPTQIGVGTIIEPRRTGMEINDVPQYELIFRVTPATGAPFISSVRALLDPAEIVALQPGAALPVRFNPGDIDRIAVADLADPEVDAALLQWRIDRGLHDPRLVAARRNGIVSPASVLAMQPTGRRREGQVELQVRLLVTPRDGSPTWQVETAVFVMPEALSRVQVGAPVYAQYEPHAPMVVALRIEIGTETVR